MFLDKRVDGLAALRQMLERILHQKWDAVGGTETSFIE